MLEEFDSLETREKNCTVGHLLGDVSVQTFVKQLLKMRYGKLPVVPETQKISFSLNFCQLQSSIENIEKKVFPNITNNFRNHD